MYQTQRPVGVTVPQGQHTTRTDKADLTVEHVMPIEFFAAQYVEKGKVRNGLFCLTNDTYYLAENGESWVNNLKELSSKLSDNFRAVHTAQKAGNDEVPSEDLVDITAQRFSASDKG